MLFFRFFSGSRFEVEAFLSRVEDRISIHVLWETEFLLFLLSGRKEVRAGKDVRNLTKGKKGGKKKTGKKVDHEKTKKCIYHLVF